MKLLLSRGQTNKPAFSFIPLRIGKGVVFKLTAQLELEDEEKKLFRRYDLVKVALVTSDTANDLRRGFRPALILGVISYLVMYMISSIFLAIMAAGIVTIVMTIVYFYALREQVMVSELVRGWKTFQCDSVVALIEKEDELHRMCQYLRQVIESSKYWDDREAISIKPLDRAELKKAILQSSR